MNGIRIKIGDRNGALVVIDRLGVRGRSGNVVWWRTRCDCGAEYDCSGGAFLHRFACVGCVRRVRLEFLQKKKKTLPPSKRKKFPSTKYQGNPCKYGHAGMRYESTGNCVECMKLRSVEFEASGKRKARNPVDRLRTQRKYLSKDDNRRRHVSYGHNYRARKRAAGGTHTGADIERIYVQQKGRCAYCRTTLSDGYEVDHIVPLSAGGTNDPANVQLLCDSCNSRKSGLDPIEFSRRIGLLL